ncbi:MAG: membrane protein insertion efficiency factor YidD [Alphaproteobacteria bacterium]
MYSFALWICLAPIFIWRYVLASLFPPACRFEPSCSRYAEEALRKHGIPFGIYLTIRRLLRCHPLGKHGYDPVPSPRSSLSPPRRRNRRRNRHRNRKCEEQ